MPFTRELGKRIATLSPASFFSVAVKMMVVVLYFVLGVEDLNSVRERCSHYAVLDWCVRYHEAV